MARRSRRLWGVAVCLCFGSLPGCSLWPFAEKDRTSYATPAKRLAGVQQIAGEAVGSDMSRQEQLSLELAQKIQTESDPLVREAIVKAAAQIQSQMSGRILVAALNDDDPYVRQTACRLVGSRQDPTALAELGRIAREDADVDVRLAATRALGERRDAAAIPYLSRGLEDRNPAIQLATVESLKLASGQDLGGDVGAWREWIASRSGPQAAGAAVAGRPAGAAPGL